MENGGKRRTGDAYHGLAGRRRKGRVDEPSRSEQKGGKRNLSTQTPFPSVRRRKRGTGGLR